MAEIPPDIQQFYEALQEIQADPDKELARLVVLDLFIKEAVEKGWYFPECAMNGRILPRI